MFGYSYGMVVVLFVGLQSMSVFLLRRSWNLEEKYNQNKSKRLRLLSALLTKIDFIKVNCYEGYYHQSLVLAKKDELAELGKLQWIKSFVPLLNQGSIYLVFFGAMFFELFIGNVKSEGKKPIPFPLANFVKLVPFLMLARLGFSKSGYIPFACKIYQECKTQSKKIGLFYLYPEVHEFEDFEKSYASSGGKTDGQIELKNFDFVW